MRLEAALGKRVGDLNLSVKFSITGERTGVFGPSGSGKSTLVYLLSGLIRPDKGYIRLGDEVLFDSETRVNRKAEQRRIGVVFQHAHLFPHMSVRRNILYGWKRTRAEERRIVPEALFEVLGIVPLLKRNVMTLSGGERQRVAVARTVLSCPRLILMDEPLTGLDEDMKFQIIPYLKRVSSEFGIPLIFISHSMLEMQMMTEETLFVDQGRIVNIGSTDDLARSSWGLDGKQGYINLLNLGPSKPRNDLFAYKWGETELVLTDAASARENIFELDAREILLFKRHPEAASARNLLRCRVRKFYRSGNRVRVELACGGEWLVAQVVPESLNEMGVRVGCEVIAAIKATAFRRLA